MLPATMDAGYTEVRRYPLSFPTNDAMMPEWVKILVPVFLAGQGLLVYWTGGAEHPPAPPPLWEFPASFAGWTEQREDPIDADVANTLRADRLLSRTYLNRAGAEAGLLVAWFQSQRAGASQPHSPKVCLPASGWTPESSGQLSLASAAGELTLNRYVVANRQERSVVLYWYQTRRRATAGEWASKFWLVADALQDRRTDTALVRIVVNSSLGVSSSLGVNSSPGVSSSPGVGSNPGMDELATRAASDFARDVYPLLLEKLPR